MQTVRRHGDHQRADPRPLGDREGRHRAVRGRIAAIGKAGNPDVQPGVDIVIGPGTEIIAGEGKILTAGGIDAHIHFICPQQIEDALASGITTMVGGGTGPATGTFATTCTPGPWHIWRACCRRRRVCRSISPLLARAMPRDLQRWRRCCVPARAA
jgi:hypothetical protein